jgi:hypothetical protein
MQVSNSSVDRIGRDHRDTVLEPDMQWSLFFAPSISNVRPNVSGIPTCLVHASAQIDCERIPRKQVGSSDISIAIDIRCNEPTFAQICRYQYLQDLPQST